MVQLDGRVALVSGASGGIGSAVADRLTADGASVVRSDLRAPVDGMACDVRDEASCARVVRQVLATHGHLDILVNVAGIGRASLVGNLDPSVWRDIIEVNLTGTFLLSQSALPALLETKGFDRQHGLGGRSASDAVQRGLLRLKRRRDHADQVDGYRTGPDGGTGQCGVPGLGGHPDAALLHPAGGSRSGPSGPGCFPMGRVIQPAEVAGAVAYLASDEAANVTGTTLVIDGAASALIEASDTVSVSTAERRTLPGRRPVTVPSRTTSWPAT